MKNILTLLAFLFVMNVNAQVYDMQNWKTQTDLQFFSTIQYPPNWVAEDVNASGYIIRSPSEGSGDKFRENVSLFAMEAPADLMKMDIKDFAEINFAETRKVVKEISIMSRKYVTINEMPMYLIVYNGLYNGQYLYWKQLFCLHKGAFYMLTYAGEAGKKDKYALAGGDMLYSFKPYIAIKR